MRVTYVLGLPELGGGSKVVFHHAGLLRQRGDEVTVLGEGPEPRWIDLARLGVSYHDHTAGVPRLPAQDLVIATYWTTLPVARSLGLGPLAHFCQGYEGDLAHLRPVWPEIEAVYAWPMPALAVSPHLVDFLRQRFGREGRVAPPPLDSLFRPAWRLGPRRRPWIAVPGIFEAEVKDVPTGLRAVRRLREAGIAARVLRFSILPQSPEERALLPAERYLEAVPPAAIARALRRCDLLFLPSRVGEGFGLPLLEALASGVPAVASRIPSTVEMAEEGAALVPAGDDRAFAEAARALLGVPAVWRRARALGLQAGQGFRPEAVAPRLYEAVDWARQRASQPQELR
ncbi:MAG TPA: glycosyltransferase family 4 protein [Thermoanaerobaculia bacterium]|nr:glycosyltransferase family 4 protein [Thermoanaerobaculia bacterium]